MTIHSRSMSPASSQRSRRSPIARSRTVRSVIAMAALLAFATFSGAGCSSDADRTAAVASTVPTETTARHPAAANRRLVAPHRSNFDTEIGTVGLPCQGTGKVPVVLVAGTDDPITRWDRLVEDAGQEVLLCRFDPSSTRGRATPKARADALSSALEQSGLPAPYVLVGHSLGGLTVRRFGVDHRDQLGAALLLDPTTPLALRSLRALLSDDWEVAATQADADEPVTWADVPLLVLSHDPATTALGLGPAAERAWTEGQRHYAELSPSGQFEQVPDAGHYIDHDAMNRVIHAIDALSTEATR